MFEIQNKPFGLPPTINSWVGLRY